MATLNISDLSVGDLVRWEVYDKTYDMQVSAVTDRRIYGMHDGIEYTMLLTQIRPIPITAEMLEKNGIHRTYEDDKYTIFRGDGLWAVKYSDGDWELSTPPVCRVDIKYVHQLQHALRLAGVDKEINL